MVWGPLHAQNLGWSVHPELLSHIPIKFSKTRSPLKKVDLQIDNKEQRRKPQNAEYIYGHPISKSV